jgi:hypothetical protein
VKISDLIAELQRVLDTEGDLVAVHYSVDRQWEAVAEVQVHPAGRPHGRGKKVHAEKVVAIGDEW